MENNNNNNNSNSSGSSGNSVPLLMLIDDEGLEFSTQELLSSSTYNNIGDHHHQVAIEIPTSTESIMTCFFDELLKDNIHDCVPTTTNTYFQLHHTNTNTNTNNNVAFPMKERSGNNYEGFELYHHHEEREIKKKLGKKRGRKNCSSNTNIEAVRKYRQKKKAHVASVEREVVKLRALNQQLLEDQAQLEAEVARLKCLLVDVRGRIEGEIGSFPYKRK